LNLQRLRRTAKRGSGNQRDQRRSNRFSVDNLFCKLQTPAHWLAVRNEMEDWLTRRHQACKLLQNGKSAWNTGLFVQPSKRRAAPRLWIFWEPVKRNSRLSCKLGDFPERIQVLPSRNTAQAMPPHGQGTS
jgi:hypothetical protein